MIKKLVVGGLVGGIIVFAWGCISWMVLPFHGQVMNNFKDTAAVQTTMMLNVDKPGVYLIPACPMHSTASAEAQKELKKTAMAQREKGPFAMTVVNPNGLGSMPMAMGKALLLDIIGVALAIWLLFSSGGTQTFIQRVLFFAVFGLAAGVVGVLPAWNWWGFPCKAAGLDILDLVIGYALAGVVIAFCSARCEAKKR